MLCPPEALNWSVIAAHHIRHCEMTTTVSIKPIQQARSFQHSTRSVGRAHDGTPVVKHHVPHATMVISHHPKLSTSRILHLVHRFAIVVCAVSYVFQCFNSCYTTVGLLRGRNNLSAVQNTGTTGLIGDLAGKESLRDSKLIMNTLLDGSTEPVNGTLYLQPDNFSFTPCSNFVGRQRDIHANEFERSLYASLAQDITYHIPAFKKMELIAPVVDCTAPDTTNTDTSIARFFFLAREGIDTVVLVVLSMSNQQYSVPQLRIDGPVGTATIQLIHDMREHDLGIDFVLSLGYPYETPTFRVYKYLNVTEDGLWSLQLNPASDDELAMTVTTGNRDGFYIKATTEQSNINNAIWAIETEPYRAIAAWTWIMKPVLHDSWAWVHAVQFFIGMGLLSNLAVLFLAIYRNFQAGKWWIGDAFVSISTAQLLNGAAVLVSWFMNEYWVLHEFCFGIGYALSTETVITVYDAPMRVDLFTLYLSACGIIGLLCNERIDPLFATVCFHLGYDLRLQILQNVPFIRDQIIDFAVYSHHRGLQPSPPDQELISPMQLWTTYAIGKRNYMHVARCLFPIFSTLFLIFVYVALRKIYRRYHANGLHVRNGHPQGETPTAEKHVLTVFEVATGAELENRYGLVSDYEPCLFIKGMKYASADGIYSTGFLIANQKFLLQTSDFWSIVLMKIIRRRYKNIFVYDVNGSTVHQTARLVYPHTLSFQDLVHINISVLS